MSSAICFNLDQSKNFFSGNGLTHDRSYICTHTCIALQIKKDPVYLKYKMELGRDIEKLKHYDQRIAQIEGTLT